MAEGGTPPRSRLRGIPRSIWALGMVSMFMDISSEMVHALLPIYLVTVLGTSALTVGFIEGLAEATANITKIFSGALSDWLGKRKLLVVVGYGLAAFTKPVFPLAQTVDWIVTARFIDRVGKGIRGAPRDALIADIAPPEIRGASYGLRQSLDTVGAFAGPLAATGLLALAGVTFQLVFWVAVIPAFIALALLIFGVREPENQAPQKRVRLSLAGAGRLPWAFWAVLVVASVLTLARFSEAFLILRSQAMGMPVSLIPLVLVAMNIVYALAAYPAGVIADRAGRFGVLIAGTAFLIAADVVLALGTSLWPILVGVALWGLHMGFTQGLLSTLIADAAPADLRGTAFGLFNFALGVAMLVASVVAGGLWDRYGPPATFLAGAGFTIMALAGFAVLAARRSTSTGTP
ncbi:MAG: MFS transporter [Alphaproteobacteria bacterium]|nr:MFS transporter [Alphaproteobacteria bacterium]